MGGQNSLDAGVTGSAVLSAVYPLNTLGGSCVSGASITITITPITITHSLDYSLRLHRPGEADPRVGSYTARPSPTVQQQQLGWLAGGT